MPAWLPPTLSALGVGVLALAGQYFVARRQRSGTVQTSEAADLWRESGALRQELHTQMSELRRQLEAKDVRITALEQDLMNVRAAHRDCEERLNEFKKILARREGYQDE